MSLDEISPKIGPEFKLFRGPNTAITTNIKAFNHTIPSESRAENQTPSDKLEEDITKSAHETLLFADPVAFR